MGKKARIRAKRLAEAKGDKKLIEQINALDQVIAQSTADLVALEGMKGEILAGMMIEGQEQNPGHRQMTLGDILNDAQVQAVIDIFNRPNLDDIAQTKLLKQYLGQFSAQLSAIGVDAGWLSYFLLANKEALVSMARQSNNTPEDPFQPSHQSRN